MTKFSSLFSTVVIPLYRHCPISLQTLVPHVISGLPSPNKRAVSNCFPSDCVQLVGAFDRKGLEIQYHTLFNTQKRLAAHISKVCQFNVALSCQTLVCVALTARLLRLPFSPADSPPTAIAIEPPSFCIVLYRPVSDGLMVFVSQFASGRIRGSESLILFLLVSRWMRRTLNQMSRSRRNSLPMFQKTQRPRFTHLIITTTTIAATPEPIIPLLTPRHFTKPINSPDSISPRH